MFINHRQEYWPDWLETAEFAYNNKVHSSTKMLSFKANYRQDPRMGLEIRKKGKYERAEKFVTKMKKIQKEAKAALRKAQGKMKKYADKKRVEVNEYKVGDLVVLSTKNLKYQMVGKRTEKLTKKYIEPYKIKKIVSSNVRQVKEQRKEQLTLVIIEGMEE